jgi:Flp pilus assembly protein TadD
MNWMGTIAGVLLSLTACAPTVSNKRVQVNDLPKWMTDRNSVRYDLVEHFLNKGDTVRALEILRVLRSERVSDPLLDLYMGRALHIDGMLDDAERSLVAALDQMPRDPRVHEALCLLRADQHRVEEGVAACDRATQLDQNRPESWNNLGFLLLSSDQPEEARKAIEQAVRLDGTEARYRNNLGLAQVASGHLDRGLRTFMSTSSSADAHYMVAYALERFVDVSAAVPYYQQAVDQNGHHSMARDALDRIASQSEEP